jgi:hypothetical protein
VDALLVDWLIERALDALARGEPIGPQALALVVRQYAATGRDDLRDALGPALAGALDTIETGARSGAAATDAADWLALVVDAASISDDDRLPGVMADLAARLRRGWPHAYEVGAGMRSIDACLRSLQVRDHGDLMVAAIDELERLIGLTYKPGSGVSQMTAPARRGTLDDHTRAAAALLTAYPLTGRLPYAMLADDLMQFARRCWWNEEDGLFREAADLPPGSLRSLLSNCDAARVLCRLAALYEDADYRSAAVMTEGRDHASDVQRILSTLAPSVKAHALEAAVYGLAVGEASGLR